MSIENDKCKVLSFDDVLDIFALSKSRKNILNNYLFVLLSYILYFNT